VAAPLDVIRAALALPPGHALKVLELISAATDLMAQPDPAAVPLLGALFDRLPLVAESRAPRRTFIPGLGPMWDDETSLALGIVRAYCAAVKPVDAADAATFLRNGSLELLDAILEITPSLGEPGAHLAAGVAEDHDLTEAGRSRAIIALAGLARYSPPTGPAAVAALQHLVNDPAVGAVARTNLQRLGLPT
jgi:hypothetical protein